jgi:hypothetical protein
MPAEPVPADPGRDDDLAWLDRDPMTAGEREAWLDWACEHDEPPGEEEDQEYVPLPGRPRTAAPGPNPRATGNAPGPDRRAGPGSPSPRPAGTGRPGGSAPGGCESRAAGPA